MDLKCKRKTAYYKYNSKDDSFGRPKNDSDDYWFMYLYKFPVNVDFSNNGSSNIKKGKSSKYRLKFKNWGELRKEYISVNRDNKLTEIGIK